MKKLLCRSLFIILSFITITLTANEAASIEEISRDENITYEMIILMKPETGSTPDKINEDISLSQRTVIEDFGSVQKAKWLIEKRKKIGIANKIVGLTPEEIDKIEMVVPDFSLIHPDSVEARLQRYIILTYPSRSELIRGKEVLERNPEIVSVIENKNGAFLSTPNDSFFQNINEHQWGMFDLNLLNAWDKTTGHAYIGVPDSGLDIGSSLPTTLHPDLTNFRSQFSKSFKSPFDFNIGSFHGTHVTGIIAAITDNNAGVAGVCWDCSIAFAQVTTSTSSLINGYDHLANSGVQAINSSWKVTGSDDWDCSDASGGTISFCNEIERLKKQDIMISAAAGNGNNLYFRDLSIAPGAFIQFPASDPYTIAVGAINSAGNRALFSDFSPQLDLVAPGVDIHSAITRGGTGNSDWYCADNFGPGLVNDGYGNCSGTSMSAPHITGILGLMRSVDPLLHSNNIKSALFSSAEHYPAKVSGVGHGLPDAELAVENMLGKVNGSTIPNRLTPLFSLYSATGEDSLYTTVPQMAWSAFAGTLPPQPSTPVTYQSSYGLPTQGYSQFPHDSTGNPPQPQPVAEVYIFTTKHNPITPSQDLVPLYRLSYQGSNGSNPRNTDHVYTAEQTGVAAYEGVGYKLDGIEGYIFSNQYPQPIGTEKLQRRYNVARDDHAIFPENKLNTMDATGYTVIEGNNAFIGYVYLNENADNDLLVDGFERAIGTCLYDADSDNDGKSDGDEVFDYPRTDPISVVTVCDTAAQPQYTWKDNAAGTLYTDINWNYAMGYHFTPQVNGTIDQIGGFFNGTKIVKLFNKSTGALLGQTTVTANNSWNYGFITPVTVQAGVQYTVVAYLAGSGATVRQVGGYFFPKTFGPIRIDGSTYISTSSNPNAIPTFTNLHWMWGQADIRFTAL